MSGKAGYGSLRALAIAFVIDDSALELELAVPKTDANALFSLVVFTLGSVFLFLFFALHFKMAVEKNNPESDLNKDAGLTPSGYIVTGCSVGCLVVGQALSALLPISGLVRLIENSEGFLALLGVSFVVILLGGAVANALGYPVTEKGWW